jgi:hypothetical protein
MPDSTSIRSFVDRAHTLTSGVTGNPERASNPRRRVVLHNFVGASLDVLPKLLLTDIWSHDCDVVLKTLEKIGEMCTMKIQLKNGSYQRIEKSFDKPGDI